MSGRAGRVSRVVKRGPAEPLRRAIRALRRPREWPNPDSVERPAGDRALVTGWFSWPNMHATAGDLLARDIACEWLREAGRPYDIANAPTFGPGVDWRSADPALYSDLIFVCGPVKAGPELDELFRRYAGSRRVGLDVTMLRPIAHWNPFHLLMERDSSATSRPDLAFSSAFEQMPIVGVVLVEPYAPEYPERDLQTEARAAVERLLGALPLTRVAIDTRLDVNHGELRSAHEVESLIARMDVVVTTRLHGMVLALKHGVPALAIDPVAGGSKICKQAEVVGWPAARAADDLNPESLEAALRYCLTPEARKLAAACAERANASLKDVRQEFVAALRKSD